jgi:murein DD-endopeptidase MepM/ murein hydrolase activator NlpD
MARKGRVFLRGGWTAFGLAVTLMTAGCAVERQAAATLPDRRPAEQVPVADAAPAQEAPRAETEDAEESAEEPEIAAGVFHRVEPGQTLWRIARAYGVDMHELAEINRLDDPRNLEAGAMLFVPGAGESLEVAPYPAPIPAPGHPGGPGTAEEVARDGEFIWPVAGGGVLSAFGVPRRRHRHAGIDIRGTRGQPVLAAAAGEVEFSGQSPGGYGKLVIVRHGAELETLYAHNSELLVRAGDRVERGQPLALVGRTGNATTDHCHFEVRESKRPVDPLRYYPQIARAEAARSGSAAAGASNR